jgi:prevent-host-death family protein
MIAMERRIDAHLARTQLGQIMDLAVKDNQRFVVDRRGEPAVVILSVGDYLRLATPVPDWLRDSWANARSNGLDRLSMKQIQDEIDRTRAGNATETDAVA